MTWDILIEKKIFDKLSYIIPAVLVIFAATILQKYPTLANYIVTAAMIVILLVISGRFAASLILYILPF
jgi:miniconductance mechanosensitive channel